jgi:phenylpropionate dioxygenase-like ring-hydroxylating dioxygenase large terminal subunit
MNEAIIPTYQLPAEAYFEESWLSKERTTLFANNWLYAGRAAELLEEGSYKTVTVGHNELLIVRDKQGNINALHNVCRHRGAQLVQGTGKCGTLVCPYHKWSYGLDGKMRGIASADQFRDSKLC